MSNRLINPNAPTPQMMAAASRLGIWAEFFKAALTGCCADNECENPVAAASRIADKAEEEQRQKLGRIVADMSAPKEGN